MKALLLFPNTLWEFFLNSWRLHAALLLLFWGSLTSVAFAQTKVWDKAYGSEDENFLSTMAASPDGSYLLAGTGWSMGRRYSCTVMKIDTSGNEVWEKNYSFRDGDVLNAIVATVDGGYLLGGSTRFSDIDETDKRDSDYWLIKIDAEGTQLWEKTFGGTGEEGITSLIATADGGYLIGGTSSSAKGGDKSETSRGKADYWVIKTDKNGNKLWDKTYGGSGDDALRAMVAIPNGYLLGGTSFSDVGGDKTDDGPWDRGYWIVRIDEEGNKIWNKSFEGLAGADLGAMLTTEDGGFLLGGSALLEKYSEERQGTDNYWIVKTDQSGNKVWDAYFGGDGLETLRDMVATSDGGYLLGGSSDSGISGDKTEANRGDDTDFWVVKVTASGNKVWNKTFGGNNSDNFSDMLITADGGYLLGGSSYSLISGDKSHEVYAAVGFWVVKMSDQAKQPQTITFDSIPNKLSGDAPFVLSARASSGLPVHFEVRGSATIADSILTITGIGYVTVEASQPGNEIYNVAPNVIRMFVVNKASTIILTEWNKEYLTGDEDTPFDIAAALDGGYLMVGTSWSHGNHSSINRVIKIDAGGSEVWAQTYQNRGDDVLASIVATADGGFLLGGSTQAYHTNDSGEDDPAQDDSDFWLLKIDAEGTQLWSKTFGGSGNEGLSSLIATPDGGYLLGGFSDSGIGGDKSEASRGKTDYWVIKTDGNGNKVWDKTFGGDLYESMAALLTAPDGGYLLGGTSSSNISGDKTENGPWDDEFWIVKIDADGNKVWDKGFYGSSWPRLKDILVTADGGYLLGGDDFLEKIDQPRQGSPQYYIVKTDGNGNEEWDAYFGGNGVETLSSMVATADGGYLLGGTSDSGISGDKTENGRGADYWIVKIDAHGYKVWDKTYGSHSDEELTAMLTTADGGYLLGGSSLSETGGDKTDNPEPGYGFWVIKIKGISTPSAPATLLTTVSPRAALPGDTITIRGDHLLNVSAVRFGGTDASFTVSSDSALTAVVPLTAASGKIEVETPGGKAASADDFLVLQPAIVVFAPDRGYAGAPVLLYGRHLATTKEISFNGVPTQDFTIYNDFFILARVPEGATSGKISITLKGGAQATSTWTYKALQRTAAQVIAAAEAANALAAQQTGAYPNPFTAAVTIPVLLEKSSQVRLLVYTAAGQQVREVVFGELQAGAHQLHWDGADSQGRLVKPGLYTYRFITNNTQKSGKLLKTEAR